MDHEIESIRNVLDAYPPEYRPRGAAGVTEQAGGLSGARVWRIETDRGRLCLRRWPTHHPTPKKLRFIHAVLHHAELPILPMPVRTAAGHSFVAIEGHLWELAPWLAGTPDLIERPTAKLLSAAMTALAEFHAKTAILSGRPIHPRPAPGLQSRLDHLSELLAGGTDRLQRALEAGGHHWPTLAALGERLLRLFALVAAPVHQVLQQGVRIPVAVQPCIRDIHREHVLFSGDKVTGLIDFGAMRVDHVACDVSRLLGSVCEPPEELWNVGLAAYEARRPFSAEERRLLNAYDFSTVALSGINWLEWVFRQNRRFDNRPAVERRFMEITARLSRLASRPESVVKG